MLKYIGEFIGTFVFLYIILQSNKFGDLQPFVIVIGLLAAILMFGVLTGGHFNPAVTIMLYTKGKSSLTDPNPDTVMEASGFIIAQILGGLAAYQLSKYMDNKMI